MGSNITNYKHHFINGIHKALNRLFCFLHLTSFTFSAGYQIAGHVRIKPFHMSWDRQREHTRSLVLKADGAADGAADWVHAICVKQPNHSVRCGSNLTESSEVFPFIRYVLSTQNMFNILKLISVPLLVNYLIKTYFLTFFGIDGGKEQLPSGIKGTDKLSKNCKINYLPSLMSSINASPAFF